LLLRRAVYALKRGGCRVTLLAPNGEVLLGSGPADVDQALPWDSPRTARLFAAATPEILDLGLHDAAIVYSRNTTLALHLERVATRVEILDPDPPPGAGHASEWFARPARALGFDPNSAPPPAVPTPQEVDEARGLAARLPQGFLAIHPGSGSPAKNWPASRFAQLARRLSRGSPWLLVGGPADEAAASTLQVEAGAVLARSLPPRILGALLSRAGAYVGNDSGVSHLAAAWGAPTVALFGPTDPAIWAPEGSVEVLRDAGGVASILPEAVEAAVARVRTLRSAALERPCG
jgi:Glycosyltransferase family 9 (heptosyltransferase)